MTDKVEKQAASSVFETIKWLVVLVLIGLVVWGNSYYSAVSVLYRALAITAIGIVAAFVALQTQQGKAFNQLRRDSMVELRRVVWPTRQESLQTTLVVVGFTMLVAFALFLMDWILSSLVSALIS
jgi:preprotein translocase subunit SecE